MEHWKYCNDYKHLQVNKVLASNNPYGVDILLNHLNKANLIGTISMWEVNVSERNFIKNKTVFSIEEYLIMGG